MRFVTLCFKCNRKEMVGIDINKIIEEALKLGFEVKDVNSEEEAGLFIRKNGKEVKMTELDILKLFYPNA